MEPKPSWRLTGTTAKFSSESIQFCVDAAKPSHGVAELRVDSEVLSDWRLLAVELPSSHDTEPIEELYVRANDLVATYLQTPDRTVRPQLYWRNLEPPLRGCELLISMQTSLLESCPTISVCSTLSGGDLYLYDGSSFQIVRESMQSNVHLIVYRPRQSQFSYAEIVYPNDCENLQVDIDGQCVKTRFRLFHHGLEKGVIRRGRLRSLFLPRENDFETAVERLSEFGRSPAPLTT